LKWWIYSAIKKQSKKERSREREHVLREEGSEGRGSPAGFGDDGRQWGGGGEREGFLSSTFRIEEEEEEVMDKR
jgi:hypothetical protein